MTSKKHWCEHITYDEIAGGYRFRVGEGLSISADGWEVCPVKGCGARREKEGPKVPDGPGKWFLGVEVIDITPEQIYIRTFGGLYSISRESLRAKWGGQCPKLEGEV